MLNDYTKELSLEELADRWELLKWEYGIDKLKVIEHSQRRGTDVFVVRGLSMEFEEDIVMCTDYGECLMKNFSVLMMFLKETLISIQLLPIGNGLYQERLEFADGLVLIEIAS